ncbi:MAG: ribosome silencing factor [Phormidesmis sp. CAN_BIN44]|nr:ribosome silencing factor [Phormidesmis sp. CAN_BIN44]
MTDFTKEQMLSAFSSATQTVSDDRSYQLALLAAEAADDRKGEEITLMKVGEVTVLADYFVVITGFSKVQVRAIATSIEDKIFEKMNRRPLRSEGVSEGTWVLEDYGDVIVHVLMPQERERYDLEAFWGHAPRMAYAEIAR